MCCGCIPLPVWSVAGKLSLKISAFLSLFISPKGHFPPFLPAEAARRNLAGMSEENPLPPAAPEIAPSVPLAEGSSEVLELPSAAGQAEAETPEPEVSPPALKRHEQGLKVGQVKKGLRTITHDAIIDYVLSNPRSTRSQIAEAFGYKSAGSVTIIINSDAFQARLHARRETLIDPLILGNVQDRIKGLADRSVEILEEKLRTSADGGFALKVLEVTQRAGDYGASAKAGSVQTQFVVNLPGPAASSNEWMSKFAPADAPILRPDIADLPSE